MRGVSPLEIATLLLHAKGTHRLGTMHMTPVVVFPGTQTWQDLLMHDLNVKPCTWPPGTRKATVHGGFASRIKGVLEEEQVHKFVENHDGFVIGGHSLGGACAILFASFLEANGKHVKKVYTFGVPQLASKQFQNTYRTQLLWHKTCNFYTPKDVVVTRIPYPYKKVGSYKELAVPNDDLTAFEEHDMKTYIAALQDYGWNDF